jgi:hypothetical protein
LRIDPAHHFFGLRLNDWTSIVIVVAGVVGYIVSARRRPGRDVVLVRTPAVEATPGLDSAAIGDAAPAPDAEEVTVGSDSERDPPPTHVDGGTP